MFNKKRKNAEANQREVLSYNAKDIDKFLNNKKKNFVKLKCEPYITWAAMEELGYKLSVHDLQLNQMVFLDRNESRVTLDCNTNELRKEVARVVTPLRAGHEVLKMISDGDVNMKVNEFTANHIMYIIQVYHMARQNELAFRDNFKMGRYGFIPSIYEGLIFSDPSAMSLVEQGFLVNKRKYGIETMEELMAEKISISLTQTIREVTRKFGSMTLGELGVIIQGSPALLRAVESKRFDLSNEDIQAVIEYEYFENAIK